MAGLMRPLFSRSLIAARNVVAVRGLASQQPPSKDSHDNLNKPIAKKTADPTADPKESYLADPWDILYGAERFEVAMKTKGYDDPYDMEPIKRKAVSSKADPNIVQTLADQRVVGCVCEEDTHHIEFMWIAKGETKRCECGHWYKCVERQLPDLSDFGLHLEKAHH